MPKNASYSNRDYRFCGLHIKKWAIIFLAYFFVHCATFLVVRLCGSDDPDDIPKNVTSTSKLYFYIFSDYDIPSMIIDAICVVCMITFFVAIFKEKSAFVWPMRVYYGLFFILGCLATIIVTVTAILIIFGIVKEASVYDKKTVPPPIAELMNMTGRFFLLIYAMILTAVTTFAYFLYTLTSRFQEYLRDVENGVAGHQAGMRLVG